MYYVALRMMRTPRTMDPDLIIGTRGRVVDNDQGRLQVQINGETWHARGANDLNVGDTVEATSRDGLMLEVSRWSGSVYSSGA
jgi:membrane protein implicated in regulation of membrane protease activity